MEEARDREQRDVRERDEVVRAEEDVELGRVQPLDRLVVDGEVEDGEEVLRVLVDLRPLPLREHVLDVERVPAEALGELVRGLRVGMVEVDPGQPAGGELERDGAQRARRPGPRRSPTASAGCGAGWAYVLSGSSSVGIARQSTRRRRRFPAPSPRRAAGQAPVRARRAAPGGGPRASPRSSASVAAPGGETARPPSSSQSPVGEAASSAPPAAGPIVKPTCQESAEIAM